MARVLQVILVLMAGLLPAQGRDPLAELVERLGDRESHAERSNAYITLLRLRDPAVIPLLVRALPHFDPWGQGMALRILEDFPLRLSQPAYRALIDSKSPFPRLAAAIRLHQAGVPGMLGHVATALETEKDPEALRRMLFEVRKIRAPQVTSAVRSMLARSEPGTVRDEVLFTLLEIRDLEARQPAGALLEAEKAPGPQACLAAFLFVLGEASHSTTLAEALRTGTVSPSDFWTVCRFLALAPALARPIQEALLEILENPKPDSRLVWILELFGKFPYPSAARALRGLLTHEDSRVASAAFDALVTCSGDSIVPRLRELLESEDDKVRLLAAGLLRRLDDHTGLPVVLALLRSATDKRVEVVKTLGGFRDRSVIAPLIHELGNDDVQVRIQAFQGLTVLLPALFPYRRFDLRSLYDPQGPAEARAAGARALAEWWDGAKDRDW